MKAMPMPPEMRRATTDDAARIASFHLRIWRETYEGIAPPHAVSVLDEGHRLRQWQATLAQTDPGHAVWLAEDKGRTLGLVATCPPSAPFHEGLGQVSYLYIDPTHRRSGLGRRMLDAALTHLRDTGFPGAALAVVRQNHAARRFYRRLGGIETLRFTDPGPVWPSDDVLVVWRDGQLSDGPVLGWAAPTDLPHLGAVAFDAVRNGPSRYTPAQRAAWLPASPDWAERLADQRVALARTGDDIVGFMSLRSDGYVDHAFIRPQARGQGLFSDLFAMIEAYARETGHSALTTHASLAAQGPFASQGFTVLQHERVERNGQWLDRAEMRKDLI